MKKQQKSMVGRVISDKMDKTVVVAVETLKRHRLYGKTMRSVKHYKAHNEENEGKSGDLVRIEETRPLSKEKRWTVVEILERAK
jgi:small subunit ribosomal protein S17